MKKNISLYILLLVNINLNSSDFVDDINDETNYREIKCDLQPILRLRDSSDNVLKNLIERSTHPNIPFNLKSHFFAASNNWAGYVVGKNLSNVAVNMNTVSFVAGSWFVPKIQTSAETTYCATWIGIDGFNNHTVEQIGTEQEYIVSNSFKGQFNYAWIEMFPQSAQIISGFPVEVGDIIRAAVKFIGDNHFSLTIANRTKSIKTTILRTLANPAQRICAEWIVEAPFLNGILPLGNFGTVNFRGCDVRISGVQGVIRNPNWQRLAIAMVTPTNIVKASTSRLNTNGNGFKVTWRHK